MCMEGGGCVYGEGVKCVCGGWSVCEGTGTCVSHYGTAITLRRKPPRLSP